MTELYFSKLKKLQSTYEQGSRARTKHFCCSDVIPAEHLSLINKNIMESLQSRSREFRVP